MVKVFSRKHRDEAPGAIYVGRPTIYGNPFTHIADRKTKAEFIVDSVEQSIRQYTLYLKNKYPDLKDQSAKDFFAPLLGKDLVCWCAPKGGIDHMTYPYVCHAQILAYYAELCALTNPTLEPKELHAD